MDNLEKSILEEIKRYKQINHNSNNLNEQSVGGVGNLGMGSHVKRIMGDMYEQEEDETDFEVSDEEVTPEETPDETDFEVGDEEVTPEETPDEVESEIDMGGAESGAKEIDVTDLVKGQEKIETEVTTTKTSVVDTNEKLSSLLGKLSELESQLQSMDELVKQIDSLDKKIEKFRPKTSEEKMELRKHDSGPFNRTLSDFWDDSQDKFEKTGKTDYILTKSDVENFSDMDIKQSFDPNY